MFGAPLDRLAEMIEVSANLSDEKREHLMKVRREVRKMNVL